MIHSAWNVSAGGGIVPRWSRDGRELYYIGADSRMMVVPIRSSSTSFEFGEPMAMFQTRIVGGGEDVEFDVSADGRFLITTELEDTAAPITLLLHWTPPESK